MKTLLLKSRVFLEAFTLNFAWQSLRIPGRMRIVAVGISAPYSTVTPMNNNFAADTLAGSFFPVNGVFLSFEDLRGAGSVAFLDNPSAIGGRNNMQ
jgi:hypothetical protein